MDGLLLTCQLAVIERKWLVDRLAGFAPIAGQIRWIVDDPSLENRWLAAPGRAFAASMRALLDQPALAFSYLERARRAIERREDRAPNATPKRVR